MKVRPILISGDIATVSLTKGYSAVIDESDVPLISGRNWSALVSKRRKAIYAARVENGKMILMHRLILGAPRGMDVDHIDQDGLNNRRLNIRVCSRSENCRNVGLRSDNKSGQKGVSLCKETSRWQAEIQANGSRTFLGYFDDVDEAASAYAEACRVIHGSFARPR